MPLLGQLANSSFLKLSQSSDFDHFRSIESLADARSIPLDSKNFASAFAAMTLRSCSIYLQRTFPRILQAGYHTTGAIIGFAMNDSASVLLDGVQARLPALLLVKGTAICEIVERQANMIAFVNFSSIDDRGWADGCDLARLIATRPVEYQALQAVTREILMLASHSPETLLLPRMVENLEESLLQAVDHAVHAASPAFEGKRANLVRYLSLVRKLDELLHYSAGKTIYSAEVARQLGVSVRTLHNAVMSIRGMSMHRYTRMRRLWNVRQRLVHGSSAEAIKMVALANGFWHMGEFSSQYRNMFGETPQQTVLASRQHKAGLS